MSCQFFLLKGNSPIIFADGRHFPMKNNIVCKKLVLVGFACWEIERN
jgi:hypothetical protein